MKMNEMFEGSYINPFNYTNSSKGLVNFSTGVLAPLDIESSLCGALKKGEQLVADFVSQLLQPQGENQGPQKSFYDPLPRPNIKTMSDMTKTVKVKNKTLRVSGETMYLRLLAINSKKKVPISRVMSFENAPVLLSMFSDDGSMIKGTKSVFMQKLESLLDPVPLTNIDTVDTVIFDGHAVIQSLPVPAISDNRQLSFSDMAKAFLSHIVAASKSICATSPSEVHVVFDRVPNHIHERSEEVGKPLSNMSCQMCRYRRIGNFFCQKMRTNLTLLSTTQNIW